MFCNWVTMFKYKYNETIFETYSSVLKYVGLCLNKLKYTLDYTDYVKVC